MTPSEVEEALREEGDKYIGKTVKCLGDGQRVVVGEFVFYKNGELWYRGDIDGVLLMKDGVWAEIVGEKTKSIEERLTAIEKQLNKK